MINEAVNRGELVGVYFPESGVSNVQTFHADDVGLVIRAMMCYVLECQRILKLFGSVFGLHCIWEKTKATFIPGGPPPALFWLLPWLWEEDVNATRYLGFPVANRFFPEILKLQIQASITSSINKLKLRHLTLAGRVLVANSLILSTIWFFLVLWAGDLTFLTQLQSQIDCFIWAGRSRVARNLVTQPQAVGGLGLLLIVEQYWAIIGNLLLWILGKAPHPLKVILRSHIRIQSHGLWGFSDFNWVVAKGSNQVTRGLDVWRNFCPEWNVLKSFITPLRPRNVIEWRLLPLWCPHVNHRDSKLVKCKSLAQHRLRGMGIMYMGDILTQAGEFIPWSDLLPGGGDWRGERAYLALISNLHRVLVINDGPGLH